MLTLPHSTKGGRKGAVFTICNHLPTLNQLPCARGSSAAHVLSRVLPALRHVAVWEQLFLPTLQYPGLVAEVSRGKKNIQANKQRKREESGGWSQPATPPKAEEESQAGHTEKSRRMNGHMKYMFS